MARSRSLLERLREWGTWLLAIKDFGTIQSLPPLQRNPIYGQMREIYDGSFKANYGTGVEVDWEGQLGLLVGATLAVDRQQRWSQELGERFVQYRPTAPDAEKVAQKALQATAKEQEHREAIGNAYQTAFGEAEQLRRSSDNNFQQADAEAQRQAAALALFVAEVRRPVHRDRYYSGKYEVLPPEGPGRLVKVLIQLYLAAVICYAGDRPAATRLVCRIATDSMLGRRSRLLRELATRPDGVTASTSARLLECDEETARRELNDLVAIGFAISTQPAKTDIYKPSEKLLRRAHAVFPDEPEPQRALQKLFNSLDNSKQVGEREEEGE